MSAFPPNGRLLLLRTKVYLTTTCTYYTASQYPILARYVTVSVSHLYGQILGTFYLHPALFVSVLPCTHASQTEGKSYRKCKVKVKLSLCLTKHLDMKIYWDSGGIASRPVRFTLREGRKEGTGSHWIGGWVDPRAVLDAVVKRKTLIPCRDLKPRISSVSVLKCYVHHSP
jgi:hypothetical protein